MTALVFTLLLFIACMGWALWAQRREIARLQGEAEFNRDYARNMEGVAGRRWTALDNIEFATREQKTGTAQKVNRMAKDALK